ncbi:MAG: rubredoxin-like domain-containing protein [Nitrososphaerales archaeon]
MAVGWRCGKCEYMHYEEFPPEKCPKCDASWSAFTQLSFGM